MEDWYQNKILSPPLILYEDTDVFIKNLLSGLSVGTCSLAGRT
jgi:hypothetical protein